MAGGPTTSHFARLLDRIRAGDPSARDQLVNDAYWRVQALTRSILRDNSPAAGPGMESGNVVSISLERFLLMVRKGLPRVPENPAELFGLVATIVRRVVIDEVRRVAGPQFRAQFPSAELPAEHPTPGAKVPQDEVLQRLAWQEMVDQLPADERQLIDWRFVFDMSIEEMAAESGVDPSTVRRRLHKVLLKLRRVLPPPGRDGTG